MKTFFVAVGLGLAVLSGAVDAFVAPAAGGFITVVASGSASRSTIPVRGHAPARLTGYSRSIVTAPALTVLDGGGAARDTSNSATALSARGGRKDQDDEKPATSAASMSGVGSTGSNALLLLAVVMVVKGLLLPEDVRHLGFCPPEDPVRGKDTLPWKMMIDSGRQCGTITEVMTKYVTAPLAFPGTPEWGMMLNAKEELAKDAWLN